MLNKNMNSLKKLMMAVFVSILAIFCYIGYIFGPSENKSIIPADTSSIEETMKVNEDEIYLKINTLLSQLKTPLNIPDRHYGGSIELPLEENLKFIGSICAVKTNDSVTEIGGVFERGTFFFIIKEDGTTSGCVFFDFKTAYVLEDCQIGNSIIFIKKPIREILCINPSPLALGIEEKGTPISKAEGIVSNGTVNSGTVNSSANVPLFNSNIKATVQYYIDFRGGYISEPYWNGGKLTQLKSSGLSEDEMNKILNIVAARYAPFLINITTDYDRFAKAKNGYKQRLYASRDIDSNILPRGYAGIASTNGLNNMLNNKIPANTSTFVDLNKLNAIENAAEAIAHEFGHTLGLSHDGVTSNKYFTGQSNWAPVMGAAYNVELVQFSNGDYLNATNKQDDIQIISRNIGVGFVNSEYNVYCYGIQGSFSHSDTIVSSKNYRSYTFSTQAGGNAFVSVKTPEFGMLKMRVDLINRGTNKIIASSSPEYGNDAIINTSVPKGTYLVKIYGVGKGDPLNGGYSNYGSVGKFTIRGSFPKDGGYTFGKLVPLNDPISIK